MPPMLTVHEAQQLIAQHALMLPPRRVPLSDTLGLILAEDVTSDIDSPPHDRSIVDGYAVRTADFVAGQTELTLLEEVTAGMVPSREVTSGTTTRIMTGAPIPAGADAVVMVERSTIVETHGVTRIQLVEPKLKSGQNIAPRGNSIRRGERVLERDRILGPIDLGVLAEVGRAEVLVTPRPRVAILATGNELVTPAEVPGPGQIRNSNETLLHACVQRAGGDALPLGIARDDRDDLRKHILAGLDADVLLLSGGVSAGVLDLVPSVLAEVGVQQIFHKVSLKPGKPLWFGVCERAGRRTLVFGLPGNPVSGLVCFRLFVYPALYWLRGFPTFPANADSSRGKLAQDFVHRGDRPTYYPAKIETEYKRGRRKPREVVTPLNWRGSGDLRTLLDAQVLIAFPPGDAKYTRGDKVNFIWLR